jgi:hypothetical protein
MQIDVFVSLGNFNDICIMAVKKYPQLCVAVCAVQVGCHIM